ncbi:MAG: hypothetical protein K8H88_18505 [Sandaracinaceae bacterium]|nr:hypothetical protein [Sandaracinaceae bacterium]
MRTLLALVFLLSGCTEPVTEVMLVIDTDLSVPDELDGVNVSVLGTDGLTKMAVGPITTANDLPRTVALVHRGGPTGPLLVTVTGTLRGGNRIQRRARFSFVPGEIRVLRVDLLRQCLPNELPAPCGPDETCGPTGCRAVDVQEQELLPYAPPTRLDGGAGGDATTDAGCVPTGAEVCNGADDDCNGMIDDGIDLQSDPENCGRCGNVCDRAPANGFPLCVMGQCDVGCDNGFADCAGGIADGCEAVLSMPQNCGSCTTACSGGTPFCEEGAVGFGCVATCSGGLTDCSGACVDTTSDPAHCGTCGMLCADRPNSRPTCMNSGCTYECDPGFYDCNGMPEDGCESRMREDDNCGGCNVACSFPNATVSCATGTCEIVACTAPFEDCTAGDGCETDTTTDVARCGSCTAAPCPTAVDNAVSVTCTSGRCMANCQPGWGDCDGMVSTGCETRVDDAANCGACGIGCSTGQVCVAMGTGIYACSADCPGTLCGQSCVDTAMDPANCGMCDRACPSGMRSTPTCMASTCGLMCEAGWEDCNTTPGDGCEVNTAADPASCGSCTASPCPTGPNATATCAMGACGLSCTPGFADCTSAAGCETQLATDPMHCGACGNACRAGPNVRTLGCANDECTIVECVAPWADCDGTFANGCETDTSLNRNHCGRCDNRCQGAAGNRCCSGSCANMC